MGNLPAYLKATKHPWACLLFVLPLLLMYEGAVASMGGDNPASVRNGADNWLRVGLAALGVAYAWLPPGVLVFFFATRCRQRWDDRPGDLVGTLGGMALESVAYALGLWGLSRGLPVLLERYAHPYMAAGGREGARRLVSFLGAGLYEEALFRLVLYGFLLYLLEKWQAPFFLAFPLAAAASAAAFAAAHHVGPYGEAYVPYLFFFRLLAGVYFAAVYQLRGFGIAVGAHACYN